MEIEKVGDSELPEWITPDPEVGEKGKLLFIERWAWKKRFPK